MRLLILTISVATLFLAACQKSYNSSSSGSNYSSGNGTSGSTNDPVTQANLNALNASVRTNTFDINYSSVLGATSVTLPPYGGPLPPTPTGGDLPIDPIPGPILRKGFTLDRITGTGTLGLSVLPVDATLAKIFPIKGMYLATSFGSTITGGADCFAKAQDAVTKKLTLEIKGSGTIIPITIFPQDPSFTPAAAASADLNGILANPPIPPMFSYLFGSVVLSAITSCTEGSTVVVTPPPFPPGPPTLPPTPL